MMMLGGENATRCTWVDLINSPCLAPGRTNGVPGVLPAELGHYLWDLSDLSGTEQAGDSLSLADDLLQLEGSDGAGSPGRSGRHQHGLRVGVLAVADKKPSRSDNVVAAVTKLSHVIRVELRSFDSPINPGNASSASLVMPAISEARLREYMSSMTSASTSAVDGKPAETGVILAGPDVLLLEDPLDVILLDSSLRKYDNLVNKASSLNCHNLKRDDCNLYLDLCYLFCLR
jgi:hypothetical protein